MPGKKTIKRTGCLGVVTNSNGLGPCFYGMFLCFFLLYTSPLGQHIFAHDRTAPTAGEKPRWERKKNPQPRRCLAQWV